MPQRRAHAFLSWGTVMFLALKANNRGKQGGPKGHMLSWALEEVFSRENARWGECVCVSVVHVCVTLMGLWGCHWGHHSIPDTYRGRDNLGKVTGSERKQEPQHTEWQSLSLLMSCTLGILFPGQQLTVNIRILLCEFRPIGTWTRGLRGWTSWVLLPPLPSPFLSCVK